MHTMNHTQHCEHRPRPSRIGRLVRRGWVGDTTTTAVLIDDRTAATDTIVDALGEDWSADDFMD
jgi:hypothetical protein